MSRIVLPNEESNDSTEEQEIKYKPTERDEKNFFSCTTITGHLLKLSISMKITSIGSLLAPLLKKKAKEK